LALTEAVAPTLPSLHSQVTFLPGLEGLGRKIEAERKGKEAQQAETVWEQYLRRKKEKAKLRKVWVRPRGTSGGSL